MKSMDSTSDISTKHFFDITELNRYVSYRNRYSGIQRVVSKIIKKVYYEYKYKDNLYYTYFDGRVNQYKAGKLSAIVDAIECPQKLRLMGIGSDRAVGLDMIVRGALKKYHKKLLKYFFHYSVINIAYVFKNNSKLKRYGLSVEEINKSKKYIEDSKISEIEQSLVEIANDRDKLFCLDSNWQNPFDDLASLKQRGVKIHVLIYDLIPMVHAWVCDPGVSRMFVKWINNTPSFATKYLTISQHVKNDVVGFLASQDVDIPVVALPLAQQFEIAIDTSKKQHSDVNQKNGNTAKILEYFESHEALNKLNYATRKVVSTPYVLCVGTIEIRKNPLRLLQAWSLLRERHGFDLPRLVFAGHFGWYIEEFHAVMAQTGQLFGQVLVYQNPNDEELSFLYDNCLFTIMPSISEGWGLPVGESLSHGKTAVVSDNSSLPEVGGNLVEYCNATSVESIADAIWKLVSNPRRRLELEDRIANTELRTWDDVSRDFMTICGMVDTDLNTGSPRPPSPHTPS